MFSSNTPSPALSLAARLKRSTGTGFTVTVHVAFLPLSVVTVILAFPGATPVTTPFSTVATLSLALFQVKVAAAPSGATTGVRVRVRPA